VSLALSSFLTRRTVAFCVGVQLMLVGCSEPSASTRHDVDASGGGPLDAAAPDAAVSDAAAPDAAAEDASQLEPASDAGRLGQPVALRLGAADAVTRPAQLVAGPAGDLFVVGSTNGALDPQGRRGALDGLLARIAPDGSLAWVRQLGDLGLAPGIIVKAWDAALTSAGDLVVVGLINGRPAFHGRPLTSTYSGFVAAFDAQGSMRWLELLSGPDGSSEAMGVEVLADDRIVVAGYTTSSSLRGAVGLGAGDVFMTWLTAQGELLQARRYGSENEEYPAALVRSGDDLYLAYKVAPVLAPASQLALIRLDGAGEVLASVSLEDPARTEVAGLAAIERGVCAGLQHKTYAQDTGGGADYGLRCYDSMLRELRAVRGGTAGAHAMVQTVACEPGGECVLAGNVDARFKHEELGRAVDGFVVAFDAHGAEVDARRLHSEAGTERDSFTRVTTAVSSQGRIVLAGESNGELAGASVGTLDGFVLSLE
jgi:hypothetical protein